MIKGFECTKAHALLAFRAFTKDKKWSHAMINDVLEFVQLLTDGEANFPKTAKEIDRVRSNVVILTFSEI